MARHPTPVDDDGSPQPGGRRRSSVAGDDPGDPGRIVPIRPHVLSRPPRHLVGSEEGTFAMLVADERRQAEDALLRREAQLNETQRLARMGTWEFDVRSDRLTWTAEMYRVFGVDPRMFDPTHDAMVALVHPDDRDLVANVSSGAWRTGAGFDVEHRVLHEGGKVRWVHSRGKVVTGPENTPVRLYGTAQDVTDRHRTEDLLVHQALHDHAMPTATVTWVERADDLRRAVEDGQIIVHYQPELRLGNESMAGVEALVRWQHPTLGLLGPEQFVGLAEDTGLVVALGAEVLRTACREVASWLPASGPGAANVAVNLSARQLVEPGVIDTVWQVLQETGMDPSRLCLEITESVLMEDVVTSVEALLGLKALGVRLAIDDFGTGYSSLGYLRRFPVDIVKIDRSFVAGLGVDPAAEAIVAAVVNLAHALGLAVVGEGVETEQQLVMLRALGCDRAQGYLWSRPLAAAQIREWRPAEATVESTSVDVRTVLEERVGEWQSRTGRAFLLEGPAQLPTARADWGALKTVVDHLLDNAVAFSPTDRPVVISAGAGRRWVHFSVADFGIGMSREEVARCFEQFWQSEAGAARRNGRTGIGLSSVRSLVEAMGGRVTVKSASGKGSRFTVSVPRYGRSSSQPARLAPGVGDPSIVREFMRQIGVPTRRDT